jgi:2',3'-cyclic-nucleotide 2'-phosphodiesterase (5'-nucleotidase family)
MSCLKYAYQLKAKGSLNFGAKLTLPVLFVLALAGGAWASGHDLVIYHTNDVHGYAFEERDEGGRLTRLGYDRLKAVVDSDETGRKLLIDAGDVLHGQAFATARRGDLMALVLSLSGYNALAAGNHDFDYGDGRFLHLVDKYRLNFLAANVTGKTLDGTKKLILPPYLILSWSDLKVGLFGLSTPETKTTTDPRNVAELSFGDPVAAAREMVEFLRGQGVDMIIAVMHMGSEPYCQPMSQAVASEAPGIDLIVDGHSHSKLAERVKNADGGETLIVSTGSYFENLGRVYANRKPEGGFAFSAEVLPASSFEAVPADPALSRAMGALREELEAELSQVVMNTPFALDGARDNLRSRSTNLGRIICAALVEATGADAAFLNAGSIRDSIPEGEVTKGQILSVLPYGNYIYVLEITGRDLLAALNHGLGKPESGAFPQFWGLVAEAERTTLIGSDGAKQEALAARSVKIGGKPLNLNAKYRLATNDFLQTGGDGYEMFTKCEYREFATLEEVFRKFVTDSTPAALKKISDAEVIRLVK